MGIFMPLGRRPVTCVTRQPDRVPRRGPWGIAGKLALTESPTGAGTRQSGGVHPRDRSEGNQGYGAG